MQKKECCGQTIYDPLHKGTNKAVRKVNYSMDIFSFPPDFTFSKGMHHL